MTYLDSKALDKKRQVLALTERIAQEKGMLSEIALANGARIARATNTKVEKKVQKEGRIKTTVTTAAISGYFDGTAKDLVLGSTANFLVWDILEFRTSANKVISDLTVGIDSITNGTTVKVIKIGWTDAAVASGAICILKTSANEEASKGTKRPMHLPTTIYNLTQIIRETRGVTGTAMVVNNYDVASAKTEARRQVLEYFARQLDAICTSSVRVLTTLGWVERRVAGWLPFFCDNAFNSAWEVTWAATGNRLNAAGAELTQAMIDDGFQYVIENGWRLNTMLLSPAKARVVSGFDSGKIVINYEALASAETRGGAVQILKSPIDINGNIIDKMYVSTEIAKNIVRLFDRSKMYLLPMDERSYIESVTTYESSDGWVDWLDIHMTWEWTFLFENADIYSYTITNLL